MAWREPGRRPAISGNRPDASRAECPRWPASDRAASSRPSRQSWRASRSANAAASPGRHRGCVPGPSRRARNGHAGRDKRCDAYVKRPWPDRKRQCGGRPAGRSSPCAGGCAKRRWREWACPASWPHAARTRRRSIVATGDGKPARRGRRAAECAAGQSAHAARYAGWPDATCRRRSSDPTGRWDARCAAAEPVHC